MRLKNISGKWDRLKTWRGKYKKFEVTIREGTDSWGQSVDYYYFVVRNDEEDISHNSLWGNDKFPTSEEAQSGAKEWIDQKLKEIK